MKVKQNQLGIIKTINQQSLPRKWDAVTMFKHARLAKAVNDSLETLNITELSVAKSIDQNYEVNGGFSGPDGRANFFKFSEKMKPVYEKEVELPDVDQFKISDWPNLEISAEQLITLMEIGIIKEE